VVSTCMRDVRERPERVLLGTLDKGRHQEAIRSHQRHSEAIRGHQRPSEAIRGHQRRSEAIRGDQRPSMRVLLGLDVAILEPILKQSD
jgi:hypothetical protein